MMPSTTAASASNVSTRKKLLAKRTLGMVAIGSPGRLLGPRGSQVSSAEMDEVTRLLLAARDGDRSALLAAIRRSQAEVWRLAAHVVGRDDADDVTQDTFLRAWRALPSYRGDAAGRTWLLAIARRSCADALRSRVRRRRLHARLEHEAQPPPRSTADGSEPAVVHALGPLVEGLGAVRRIAF